MEKVIITRKPAYRYRGIDKAAKELGVSRTAVYLFINGSVQALSPAKRSRIVIRTQKESK